VVRVSSNFEDVVIALDSSISMRAKDYEPSRFDAAKAALKRFIEVRLSTCPMDKIGVVAFYGYALPVSELSSDMKKLVFITQELKVLGEATNLGDAIIEATRLFGEGHKGLKKKLIVLTDGTFNTGPDPVACALYAFSKGVEIHFLTMGKIEESDKAVIEECTTKTGGRSVHAEDLNELMAHATAFADRLNTLKYNSF
jgi:Ca-activated chloride channel family protein